GIVACTPGRGYAVKPLSAEDVRDAFPMLISLEDLGVAGLSVTRDLISRLDELNRQIATAAPDAAPELDLAWHHELASAVDNARLRCALLELQACAQRYESLDRDGISRAVSDHDEITRALELSLDGDDQAEAARKLRRHREATMRASLDRLDSMGRARRPLARNSAPSDALAGHA
ncbi:MAG: FCD domain-containing protein, partial [Planctomycetota bacterium]